MQKLEMHLERMEAWNGGPARVTVLGLTIQKGFVQLRESIEPRLSLARPGISIYIVLDYFLSFIELLFLICFHFLKFGGQSVANDSI